MKLILEIQDNKAQFFLELIKNFSFVKAKPITPEKALLMEEVKEAVDNLNMVKKGEIEAKPLNNLLDEL